MSHDLPRLRAQKRPFKINIERKTAKTDSRGQPFKDVGWESYAKPWASIYWGSGAEQREAAQQKAVQTASFELLADSRTRTISTLDRLIFRGAVWEIQAVSEIDFNRGIKITATCEAG